MAGVLVDLECDEVVVGDKRLANFLPATLNVSKFLARSNTTVAVS